MTIWVALCCGLNFSPSVANSPTVVLSTSFLELVNVCFTAVTPFLNRFFYDRDFLFINWPVCSGLELFGTSISKPNSSTYYLELASQRMAAFSAPPCLCLHACPALAALTLDMGPESASLNAVLLLWLSG